MRGRGRERERGGGGGRERDRQTEGQRQRERQTEKEKDRQTHRHTETDRRRQREDAYISEFQQALSASLFFQAYNYIPSPPACLYAVTLCCPCSALTMSHLQYLACRPACHRPPPAPKAAPPQHVHGLRRENNNKISLPFGACKYFVWHRPPTRQLTKVETRCQR